MDGFGPGLGVRDNRARACGRPTQPQGLSFICFPRSSQYVHLQKTSRLVSVPAGDLSSRASSLMPRNTLKLQASAHLTWCCFTKLRTPVELLCTWGVEQDSHFARVAFLKLGFIKEGTTGLRCGNP